MNHACLVASLRLPQEVSLQSDSTRSVAAALASVQPTLFCVLQHPFIRQGCMLL